MMTMMMIIIIIIINNNNNMIIIIIITRTQRAGSGWITHNPLPGPVTWFPGEVSDWLSMTSRPRGQTRASF